MDTWKPTTREEVESLLSQELEDLHPVHLALFEPMRVTPRRVPVTSDPGQYVYVVAEYQGKVLYWSDVEEGWELEALNDAGGITERGCSQFELSHVMYQLFGDPDATA
jgi:hypothetical protein